MFPLSRFAGEGWGEGTLVRRLMLEQKLPSPALAGGLSRKAGEANGSRLLESASARETLDDITITRRNPLAVAMTKIIDDRFAADDDAADQIRVAREHERVKQMRGIAAREQRRRIVEHDEIRARGFRERTDRNAGRLRAARQRVAE